MNGKKPVIMFTVRKDFYATLRDQESKLINAVAKLKNIEATFLLRGNNFYIYLKYL